MAGGNDLAIGVTMTGGQIQGVAGAGSVVIENFTIYNRAPEEPELSSRGWRTDQALPLSRAGVFWA